MPFVKSGTLLVSRLRRVAPIAMVRVLAAFALPLSAPAQGADVLVAVAANFVRPAERIVSDFAELHGADVALVAGSTGKLYAQIRNGAPFDVFLAADQRRPALLEDEGLALAGSRFTYAVGRLALWSGREDVEVHADMLRRGDFRKLAIANPELAPYGQAAREVLSRLGALVWAQERLVTAESVGQAFALAATGNADLGMVAAAQAQRAGHGSLWLVPESLHAPIRQDAVMLARARDNAIAAAFVAFLRTDARAVIASLGYGVASR
ncbi:MAG: molybdate ABC transporter substrate-binding protein [Gammaproteobacteria bacterium]|nr:molybdate ABC transporter substrate-binding protein [Gammaproteobacteria bacterium]